MISYDGIDQIWSCSYDITQETRPFFNNSYHLPGSLGGCDMKGTDLCWWLVCFYSWQIWIAGYIGKLMMDVHCGIFSFFQMSRDSISGNFLACQVTCSDMGLVWILGVSCFYFLWKSPLQSKVWGTSHCCFSVVFILCLNVVFIVWYRIWGVDQIFCVGFPFKCIQIHIN